MFVVQKVKVKVCRWQPNHIWSLNIYFFFKKWWEWVAALTWINNYGPLCCEFYFEEKKNTSAVWPFRTLRAADLNVCTWAFTLKVRLKPCGVARHMLWKHTVLFFNKHNGNTLKSFLWQIHWRIAAVVTKAGFLLCFYFGRTCCVLVPVTHNVSVC